MKPIKILLIIFPLSLLAVSPLESPKEKHFNLSVFNTKKTEENVQVIKNKKINCRYICDKKIYKEQRIAKAISFYKMSAK